MALDNKLCAQAIIYLFGAQRTSDDKFIRDGSRVCCLRPQFLAQPLSATPVSVYSTSGGSRAGAENVASSGNGQPQMLCMHFLKLDLFYAFNISLFRACQGSPPQPHISTRLTPVG